MAYPKNENIAKFRKEFLNYIEKKNRGDYLKDSDIKDFLDNNQIKLTFSDAASLIRQMELVIGVNLKKRLKRIRKEGYLILEAEVQADMAIKEGKEKIQVALKKTSQRLDSVDISSFSKEQQRELLHRTNAVDALLAIVKNSSMSKKVVNKKEVELLNETALQSKYLKDRKED